MKKGFGTQAGAKTSEENSLFLVAFQLVTRVNRYLRNTWLSTGGNVRISDYIRPRCLLEGYLKFKYDSTVFYLRSTFWTSFANATDPWLWSKPWDSHFSFSSNRIYHKSFHALSGASFFLFLFINIRTCTGWICVFSWESSSVEIVRFRECWMGSTPKSRHP